MVIFICGSINSGKSTVSKLLAEKIDKPAIVEIDVLSAMLPGIKIDDKIQLNLENGLLLVRNFVKHGYSPIVPYPISIENHRYVMESLSDFADQVRFFVLNPDLATASVNRGERELDDWERERIKYHYDARINNPGFGTVIDNSHQTPEETVEIILDNLKTL